MKYLKVSTLVRYQLLLTILLSYSIVNAIELEQPLPLLNIHNGGEITLHKGKPRFTPWSSNRLNSPVSLLQVLTASQKSADLNKPYFDQFSDRFERNTDVNATTIVLSDNIPYILSGFVKKELKKNKLQHPRAIMINDKKGKSRQIWGLPETQSVMMLIDSEGVVRKYHEGKLQPSEQVQWLNAVDQLLVADQVLVEDQSLKETK